MPTKTVLGVDASTANIGFAVMDYDTEKLLNHGVIPLSDKMSVYMRIAAGVQLLYKQFDPATIDILVIEESFFWKNAMTGKLISYMVGACMYAGLTRGIGGVKPLSPTEIKKAFTSSGKADKDAIRAQVRLEFGLSVESEDEADAIAIASAYCTLQKEGIFAHRQEEKTIKRVQKAKNRRLIKAGKPLPGELPL